MQASASVPASGDSKAAIGEALKQALAGIRLQSLSLHDERGDVLWLDEGALGPDEHNIVLEAASALTEATDQNFHFVVIGDGRSAAFLPARSPLNDLLGLAMIIADSKFLDAKGAAKFVSPITTNLMRRLAFLRKPPAPAPAPAPAAPAAPANKVASPPPGAARPAAPAAARPGAPAAARPGAPAARPGAPAAPGARPAAPAPAAQRPAAPPAAKPAAPAAARPAVPPAKPAAPAAKAPPARPAAPAAPGGKPVGPAAGNMQQRTSGSADSDSIAFEISDIDPKSLLKGPSRGSAPAPEPKRPDLRVVQTDRIPKPNFKTAPEPVPELIADDSPPEELPQVDVQEDVGGEEVTTEVATLDDPENNMNVEGEFVEESPPQEAGAGQFDYYGQIFELHVQQLVKLKGSGGTRRFEVLVRDAYADNEFGTAPERVIQDANDPSANSDLDRIVVELLARWMGDNRAVWEAEPSSFSVNVGMGTIADPKFISYVAGLLKNQKIPAKAMGFEISDKSCIEQVAEVDAFVQACEKLGCHVVLDDFTFHHNAMRWLGSSALKFIKLDAKITGIAMKEKVAQAMVVAVTQASKVLGLSCVAKRVDTPAQRDWLSAVGLDYAQGFLLDQPKQLISLGATESK